MGTTKEPKYRTLMYDIFIFMAIGILFIIFQYKVLNSIIYNYKENYSPP
jgi:uncharacterized MnhB-related membrane protein